MVTVWLLKLAMVIGYSRRVKLATLANARQS